MPATLLDLPKLLETALLDTVGRYGFTRTLTDNAHAEGFHGELDIEDVNDLAAHGDARRGIAVTLNGRGYRLAIEAL